MTRIELYVECLKAMAQTLQGQGDPHDIVLTGYSISKGAAIMYEKATSSAWEPSKYNLDGLVV